jgi:chromosome segregation ATPase
MKHNMVSIIIVSHPNFSDRVVELETKVQDLEAQISEQAREAESAISAWQDNCTELEERCSQLEQECSSLRGPVRSIGEDNPESTTEVVGHGDRTMDGAALEVDGLVAKLSEKEEELRLLQETLAYDESIVEQWSGMFPISCH